MNRASYRPRERLGTHEVINQPEPLRGNNAFTSDIALRDALTRFGGH